jgi:rhodanese-related sulfurtransferase
MSSLVADVNDLKSRLEWGQPAFTMIDVRDRHTYNHGHITGAMSIPLDDLAEPMQPKYYALLGLMMYLSFKVV